MICVGDCRAREGAQGDGDDAAEDRDEDRHYRQSRQRSYTAYHDERDESIPVSDHYQSAAGGLGEIGHLLSVFVPEFGSVMLYGVHIRRSRGVSGYV